MISHNHIYRCGGYGGIWLDWMAQGARVTRNLLHDKDGSQDVFFEVNHGPFMVDHNICLSRYSTKSGSHWNSRHSVLDVSQGGAYAHNLFVNGLLFHTELRRDTPYMKANSTAVAGLRNIPGGDDRFYNNILVHRGFDDAGANLAENPVGTGPYTLAEFQVGERCLLTRRTDGEVSKTVKARDLWRQISEAAWACADPGLQFDTIINEWHTCPEGGRIRGSNPCSEYMFLDDTACNLASMNLLKAEGLVPEDGVVIAGCGPLLWLLAWQIKWKSRFRPAPCITKF